MTIKFLTPYTFGYNGAMSEALRVWLSQELDRLDWSHRKLAGHIGFSHSYVSKTISGERNPSPSFCIKVAQALEVSPEMVLRLAGILPPASPASPSDDSMLNELVELARNLPPEDRQQILEYVRFIYQKRKG